MAEAAGKFQLIDGDDDKMDAILAEMGASDQIRHLNKTVKPIVEYSREGDEYVAKATAPGLNKEHTHKFRLTLSSTKPPWMDAKSRAPTSASVTLWSKLKSGTAKLLPTNAPSKAMTSPRLSPAEPWSPRGSTREFE